MEEANINNQIIQPAVSSKKKWLVFLLGLAALVVFLAAGSLGFAAWQVYQPSDKNNQQSFEFVVEKGFGVKEIAGKLEKNNLIRSAWWFEIYVWYKNQGSALQAGKYSLSPSFNIPEIVEVITGGKVISNEIKVTFPEGFTYGQIKARLVEQGMESASALGGETVDNYQVQYKFLSDAAEGASLEGFLFPDTYIFERDYAKSEIIKKFLDNFDKKLTPELREQVSRQGKKIYEIIILASIVQQEANNEEEMPLIAGVFAKRLSIGMALESDATINYVTGKKDRQPLYSDLKVKSAYNTYLNRGLPPGPICNPGLAAIKAAIAPQITDYLYFLHPVDSPTVFSKTLSEHNQNKAKWLK
ncbi:MAG TPA: endolytic transglycosylase MltG [Candidatus Portnoybacteria bacterium]|nr:endolytic transglycosylase MltG [Candidatus Portnoybacteria bacterium]